MTGSKQSALLSKERTPLIPEDESLSIVLLLCSLSAAQASPGNGRVGKRVKVRKPRVLPEQLIDAQSLALTRKRIVEWWPK